MTIEEGREPIAELTGSDPVAPQADPAPTPTPPNPTPEGGVTEPTPTPAEPQLYDLPDGRKVDADTLAREFKQNFLPDYTRKSQALAEIERNKTQPAQQEPWKSPDWQPQSYAEILQVAEQNVIRSLEQRHQAEIDQQKAIENQVNTELAELKAADPKLNEGALFQHANKYGFTNLKAAHANYMEIQSARKAAEQQALNNVKKRDADPVSVPGGQKPTDDEGYNPRVHGQFSSAIEFLQRLKQK